MKEPECIGGYTQVIEPFQLRIQHRRFPRKYKKMQKRGRTIKLCKYRKMQPVIRAMATQGLEFTLSHLNKVFG